MNSYLQTNFLVNGLFESFVIDYCPNLAFTICCPKRSGNFHSGLTNIKPVRNKNIIYYLLAYMATSGGHFSLPLGMGSIWS